MEITGDLILSKKIAWGDVVYPSAVLAGIGVWADFAREKCPSFICLFLVIIVTPQFRATKSTLQPVTVCASRRALSIFYQSVRSLAHHRPELLPINMT